MNRNNGLKIRFKIICTILLSFLLIVSGLIFTYKPVFSSMIDTFVTTKSTSFQQCTNLIMPTQCDVRIIPDKYNTGCKGDLVLLDGETKVEGITVTYSGKKMVLDFKYRNKEASDEYIIENYDFTKHSIVVYNEHRVTDKKIKLVFNNCKFSHFRTGRLASDVFSYEFNNCSLERFSGSNATFSNCHFGGSYCDGLVPFNNVTVKDSYFSGFVVDDPSGKSTHTDGTQMYGYSDSMVQNVLFSNCRFEMPAIKTTNRASYINSCIMLQMEYNDANNVVIEDCIVNGGIYSIYASTKRDNLNITNVFFRNIRIGSAKRYGNIYPKKHENVVFDNVLDQDSLYVSSVWHDGEKTHVIVSNDTNQERILRVVTGRCSRDYIIKPCPNGKQLKIENYVTSFEDFPFDVEVKVDGIANYVICFDVTDGTEKQIRYVSFDGKPTYYYGNKMYSFCDLIKKLLSFKR